METTLEHLVRNCRTTENYKCFDDLSEDTERHNLDTSTSEKSKITGNA